MATPAAASPAREEVRGVVPKLIELTEKVVYGDIWERPGFPSATGASSPWPRSRRCTAATS